VSRKNGPEGLPQFEERLLYHLVDLAGDLPMGHLDGVSETDVAARLADELGVSREPIESEQYFISDTHEIVLGAIQELENEGLLTVPIKHTRPWDLRPTRDGRRRVAQWRGGWERNKTKRDREVQRLILKELERQWRADPGTYRLNSHLDVDKFCEEYGVERNEYLANAHRLVDQGKVGKERISGAGPDSGFMHITESGRRALEAAEQTQRPQPGAQEAWVEVARLKRRLQIAERDLPSLVSDEELRRRCEDLLEADSHYDRVIREACVILENRVRRAIAADKGLIGTALMEQAFGPKQGPLRLSDHDQEQLGAMQIYRGIMAFFRNAAGHSLIETYDQEDALRFVVLVDLLLKTLGEASSSSRDDIDT
jgi:uncharacterized protein (TIGR02391 family)